MSVGDMFALRYLKGMRRKSMNKIARSLLLSITSIASATFGANVSAALLPGDSCNVFILEAESFNEANGDTTTVIKFTASKIFQDFRPGPLGTDNNIRTVRYTGPMRAVPQLLGVFRQSGQTISQLNYNPSTNEVTEIEDCNAEPNCAAELECSSF